MVDVLGAFLDMGGYGRFVWPAFGLTLAVLIGLFLASLRSLRLHEATLDALQSAKRRRRVESTNET